MAEVIVEPDAEREIADAMDWYEARDAGLGAALLAEVDAVLRRLESGELRGIGVPGVREELSIRRVLLSRFPYVAIFVVADAVHVIAFAHQKRRVGYWKDRLPLTE
jgi:toxin ParE1/3/4